LLPYGKIQLAPALPAGFGELEIEGLPVAGARITVGVKADGQTPVVSGLPEGVELLTEPRAPISGACRTGSDRRASGLAAL
jgi:hypothetical protein